MSLAITLFGPMRVQVNGQPLPHLHNRKTLWLLALLVLRHGRLVEREWLAEMLWPEAELERSLGNLRPVLSALRRALGSESERLQTLSRHTLSLSLAGANCDVLAFDAQIATKTLSSLAQAVALYTGPLLEGCAEEWVPQERRVREEDCLQALQTLAEAALAAGEYPRAADHFRRAVDLDPWREQAQRGLMKALNDAGDCNAALQIYRNFAQRLRQDLQTIPDQETRTLYDQLRSDAKRRTVEPHSDQGMRTEKIVPVVRGHLPHPLTELIGRGEERLDVAVKLQQSRLVTLTGPGGIGKTRLAVEAAAQAVGEFADGAWLVPLEALADGTQVARQIAAGLGLKEEPGQPVLESLVRHLQPKTLLLLLDNCEHLLSACLSVGAHLLRECAGVRILATSREPLGIPGETVWAVPALTTPNPAPLKAGRAILLRELMEYESVQLFVERAQAVQKSFGLTAENAPAVSQICAQLQGIPLALELAAARVSVLTAAQIAARLDDHLRLLTGRKAAPVRHQTLRAALDWSYSLLNPTERIFLDRLSVFAGGWTLEAVEQICADERTSQEGDSWKALDMLTSLIDKSLVVFEQRETEGGRYRLLEMVRQYAAERLTESGGTEQVKGRFCRHFSALAQEAEPHLSGADQGVWLTRLETEHDNLRTALAWYSKSSETAEAGLQMAVSLWRFWERRGYYSEGWAYLTEALGREGTQGWTYLRGKALNAAGVMAFYQGNYAAAKPLHEESLAISRENANGYGIAWSLNDLGKVAFAQGEYAKAKSLYEESLAIFRGLGDKRGLGWSLHQLGSLIREQGDYPAARALYDECLGISRELGDQQGIAWALNDLGSIAALQGHSETARALYEESLAISRALSEDQGMAWSLHHLGTVAYARSDLETAQALHEESLAIFRDLGNKQAVGWSLHQLGNIAAQTGEYAAAEQLQKENLAIQRDLKNKLGIGRALNSLAWAALRQGQTELAQTLYTETIHLQKELKDRHGVAESLRGLAAGLALQSDFEKAARLWGAAEAICEAIGAPIPAHEQEDYENRLGQMRLVLNRASFDAAWAEGRTLTWEQAAVLAEK